MKGLLALGALMLLLVPSVARADFYDDAAKVPAKHGKLIRAKGLTGAGVPPGGSKTQLLLYSVKGVTGSNVAVSGTITYPKGKKPKKGWPVVTWAHGTTGIADKCAPSTFKSATNDFPLLKRWLKSGWAVARTDYEGLGTPGVHPYLVGTSAGRSVLDIVLAAKKLNRKKVVISGHSQGGHATLWANALAGAYTPRLRIKGTVPFAPASHIAEQGQALGALTQPSGLSGLAATILRGVEVTNPELKIADLLSPRAAELYPLTETECLPTVTGPDAYGTLAPADLAKPYADLTAVIAALQRQRPRGPDRQGPAADRAGRRRHDRVPGAHRPDRRRL